MNAGQSKTDWYYCIKCTKQNKIFVIGEGKQGKKKVKHISTNLLFHRWLGAPGWRRLRRMWGRGQGHSSIVDRSDLTILLNVRLQISPCRQWRYSETVVSKTRANSSITRRSFLTWVCDVMGCPARHWESEISPPRTTKTEVERGLRQGAAECRHPHSSHRPADERHRWPCWQVCSHMGRDCEKKWVMSGR